MKRVLITGSNGMLGTDLTQAIKGYQLCGLNRRKAMTLGVSDSIVDITDWKIVERCLKSLAPDVVIHAAAFTDVDGCEKDPDKAFRVNCEGTKNVFNAIKGTSVLFVLISTDYIFDGKKNAPYLEEDEANPISVYGKSKWEAEKFICANAERYLIIRTSWLFGLHGKNFVDTILKLAEKEKELRVVSDQRGQPTYTSDLAVAINSILAFYDKPGQAVKEILHVVNEGPTTWFDFTKEILSQAGKKGIAVKPIFSQELGRPASRPINSVLDTARLQAKVGLRLRHWREALSDYLRIRTEQGVRA